MTQAPDIQALSGQSMNLTEHNIEQLKQLFPNVFTEGKIDFDALKSELGEFTDTDNERYQFTWNGKEQAKRIATTPTLGTLRPAPAESVNWDTTENIYIEGDNLEVLKLLQKSYFGKVKMIYIDPPYNTGNDFIYKDDFKDNLANYQRLTGQKDEEGNPLNTNTDSSGRYHSNWLNMMYPRLKLARNLLKDDGVIFISIDDNEVHNLRKVCDEIFGEGCHKNTISVRRGIKNVQAQFDDIDALSTGHEYILVYSKLSSFRFPKLILSHGFVKPGKWDTFWRGTDRPTMRYRLLGVLPEKGQWRWEEQRTSEAVDNYSNYIEKHSESLSLDEWYLDNLTATNTKLNFVRKNDGDVIQYYVPPSEGRLLSDNWMDILLSGNETEYFDTEKSTHLLKRIINWIDSCKNEITLDFFSGSATTAHALMQLNAEDGGKRKFILVQIPEPTPKTSGARKAGYETISEIGQDRIRHAAKKIKEEYPDSLPDLGFKVFKLDSSNIKKWQPNLNELETDLLSAVDNILPGRTSQDLLFEVLIKYGLPLTLPVEQISIENNGKSYQAWNVANNALIACFDENLTLETIQGIADLSTPENPVLRVVFRDTSFQNDITKTNAIQRLKQAGIEDVLSI